MSYSQFHSSSAYMQGLIFETSTWLMADSTGNSNPKIEFSSKRKI